MSDKAALPPEPLTLDEIDNGQPIDKDRIAATVEALDAARSALAQEVEKREAAERELSVVRCERDEAKKESVANFHHAEAAEKALAERFTRDEAREVVLKYASHEAAPVATFDAILDRIKKGRAK